MRVQSTTRRRHKVSNNEKKKQDKHKEGVISITPPNIKNGRVWVKGLTNTPLVIHKFSQKAKLEMKAKQEAGSTVLKGKKKQPKNFDELFIGARHISSEGWDGIPVMAFKNACLSACSLVGFKKTIAKMCLFFKPEGLDIDGETQLVRIRKAEPEKLESTVKIGGIVKTTDIAVRAKYMNWYALLNIGYDADMFTQADLGNLLIRAGLQVGVGEGRPASSTSAGMGWGMFEVCDPEESNDLDEALEKVEI